MFFFLAVVWRIFKFLCLKVFKLILEQLLFNACFHFEQIFLWKSWFFQVLLHKQKKSLFFSEGQIIRISLSLIPNALWVCLLKNSILLPETIHGGYTPLGPNCVTDIALVVETLCMRAQSVGNKSVKRTKHFLYMMSIGHFFQLSRAYLK